MFKFTIPTALIATILVFTAVGNVKAQSVVFDFESLQIPDTGFYNGDPSINAAIRTLFTIDSEVPGPFFGYPGTEFSQTLAIKNDGQSLSVNNQFNSAFGSWTGFSVSNVQDSTTAGPGNQFAAFPGSGADQSDNYLVSFGNGATLATSGTIDSIDITTTTFTALAILGDDNGDPDGNSFIQGPLEDSDGFFNLTITGFDASGIQTGQEIVALADFRGDSEVFLQTWTTLDLSSLNATQLTFEYSGSDDQPFNFLNTPTFFAVDNITVTAVPEPSAFMILSLGVFVFGGHRRKS